MKKIFTLSVLSVITAVLLAGCVKDRSFNNDNYWLSQERGEVVYSDSYCSYFVVETAFGYTIIRATGNFRPYEGSVVYGDFGRTGYRDYYNYSTDVVFSGDAVEVDLSYTDAQYAIDYYCPYGKGVGAKIKQSDSAFSKKVRAK